MVDTNSVVNNNGVSNVEYKEIPIPKHIEHASKNISPFRLKRFMLHLAKSASTSEDRINKKREFRARLEKVKSVSLNKRSTKKEIESEIGKFEDVVQHLIKDEETILKEQRRGTKEINELKGMVENLSKRIVSISNEYSSELEEKDKKILELRDALAKANIKMSESNDSRRKKIDAIEERIKSNHRSKKTLNNKFDDKTDVVDLEIHLKHLEDKHAELSKSGKHSKADVDRIKKIIDSHKEKLKSIKK